MAAMSQLRGVLRGGYAVTYGSHGPYGAYASRGVGVRWRK